MRTLAYRIPFVAVCLLLGWHSLAAQQLPYQTEEAGMTPKKRELYFYNMRAYPFGRIPQNARQDAILQADSKMHALARPNRTLQAVSRWTPVGPFNLGGRVNSIVCHPTDGKTLWIGAADGGVWKSTDRGGSWKPIMDNENAISMGAIAVDPKNPDVLYAGTGEMSSNIDAYTGAGILKTVNGGETWRPVGLTNVGAFSTIVVHPKNSNLIYAGATKNNSGLYRSTDAGNTWKRLFTESVSDVTVNPDNEAQLWVGTMGKGVYRSDNSGNTFTLKSSGLGIGGQDLARTSIQCAPSRPTTLYALVYETSGTGATQSRFSRIYKSTNSGDSWQAVYTGTDFMNQTGVAQGWYNNVLAVSPSDPNVVIAGGISIVRTQDGGATNNWYYIDSYRTSGAPHPDQHALAFDPVDPSRVYLGNDGGMYRSDNGGTQYSKISTGLAITQFYAMGVDQTHTTRTYGGTQDNGTVTNGSSSAGDVIGGDGFYVCVDYSNPDIVIGETSNGAMVRRNVRTGAGATIMDGIISTDDAAWSAPIVMDPSTSSTLWHGRHHLYATYNQGDVWVPTDVQFKGQASAIGISPVNTAIVYGGSDRGEILVTEDGGADWADRTNAPGAPNRAITDFAPSAKDANICYMTVSGFFSGHVFKTTDRGASWTDISGELPDIPINAIALHPDDEKIIYIGSDIGMFISTDGGASWANYNEGLPRVAVADLEVHKTERKLRMASHGRSMWEIPLEKSELPPSILSPNGGEIWMAGTQHAISWSGISGAVRIEYSLDDGGTWHELIDNVTAYRWNVFDTAVIAARIRVTSMTDAERTATSRSFTITNFTIGGVVRAAQVTTIPYGLAFDGEYLWATDFGGSKLLKMDPNTLATVGLIQLDNSMGDSLFTDLAYNKLNGHLYIHRLFNTTDASPGGQLFEVDKTGHKVNGWISPAIYPVGIAFIETPGGPQFMVTDRNGESQKIYFLDANNPATIVSSQNRTRIKKYGPRGLTNGPAKGEVYQVITDFTGDALQTARAEKFAYSNQQLGCAIDLTSPITAGYINSRGLEFDTRDSNLWVSDYGGNIFKIISCDGRNTSTPPPVSGVPASSAPDGLTLMQNLPNPFSTSTRISFMLPANAEISLAVYSADGRLVRTITSGGYEAGTHAVDFDGTGLASGVYRYVLTCNGRAALSRTMVYVR